MTKLMQKFKTKLGKLIYRTPFPPCNKERRKFIEYLKLKHPKFKINFLDIGCSGGLSNKYKILKEIKSYLVGIDAEVNATKNNLEYDVIKNIAISDKEGFFPFYITKSTGCSSLLKPNLEQLKYYSFSDWFMIKEKRMINTTTLDAIFSSKDFDFIQMDIQGSEYDAIIGGKGLLSKTIGISFESHLFPYYINQKLFPDIHELLSSLGFRVLRLDRRDNDGEIGELSNCVYIRDHRQIKTQQDILKRILFALIWDKKNYVEFLLRNYGNLIDNDYLINLLQILLLPKKEPVD